MVAKRDSIISLARPLCDLVINDGGNSAEAMSLALKLQRLVSSGGVYTKRYKDHEERVLNRHLNLYRNKLAKARTDAERLRWRTKVEEQEAKLAAYRGDDLDLDGL